MPQGQPLSVLAPEYNYELQSNYHTKLVDHQLKQSEHLCNKDGCHVKKPEPPKMKSSCDPCSKPEPPKMKSSCDPCSKPEPPKMKSSCDPCAKAEPFKMECDPCANKEFQVANSNNYGWAWLGAFILWFIIFTVLFWLIYYSLKPAFVLQSGSNQVDTAKVLLAAVISALILVIIIWLIKAAISRRY